MVTTFYPPYAFGGDAVYVQQLSNELAKQGHQVDVVHCKDAYHLLARRSRELGYADHPNVTVHGLKSPWSFLSPLATHQLGRPVLKSSMLRQILEKPFDVIHYHNISLIGGPAILRYGQAIKLYTLHEYWLICPTHMLFKFNHECCRKKQCFACTLAYRRPPQLWRYSNLIHETSKSVDLFLAPSEFAMNKHRKMGLKMPITELPYFTSRWKEVPNDTSPNISQVPYFLFVGRLEKLKGLQKILPLFRDYEKAELWVVGAGDYERVLRRTAKRSPKIKFLGYQSGERLKSLYQQAVALIVPSLWDEVFGIVILEAFAVGTPVIVSNRGGMPKIVEESGGGFVFRTEKELIAAMEWFMADRKLRNRIGNRGYEAMQKKWSAEVHVRRYLELIEEIAASRPKEVVSVGQVAGVHP